MGNLLHFPDARGNTAEDVGEQESRARRRTKRRDPMGNGGALDALIDRYTRERIASGEVSRQTASEQRLTLQQFAANFGGRPLARLGESDIIRWMESTSGLRPSTRRNKLSVVRSFCRWMVRRGHVRTDPTISVKSPRQPRTVPKVFEGDSVSVLLAGCPDARAELIVLFMVQMGLRCAEVAALELGDIDGRLAVVQGKGGHQRAVPLTAEVRAALDAYMAERGGCAGPLIDNYQRPGNGLSPHTISQLVRGICRAAGIKRFAHDGISAHGLRRTCASDLAERDVPMLDIAEALGHQSIETTRKYYTRHRATRLTTVMEGRWYGRRPVGRAG